MANIAVGQKGHFIFLSPYDNVYDTGKVYTIQSIRSIREMIVTNDNPFDIYSKAGLTETDFYNDMDNGVDIVTLVSENDDWIRIPESYIDNLVENIGVEYQNKSIALNLAPLPVSIDLTQLADELSQYLTDRLGVDVSNRIIETSDVYFLTQDEHKVRESNRKKAITLQESIFTRYNKILTQNASLVDQISRLECYIRNNLCKDGILIPPDNTTHLSFNFVETEERQLPDAIYLDITVGGISY